MAWTPIKLRSGGDVRFVGEAEGAGGGLPTGWSQDDSDPATVDTNGGGLILGGGGVDTGGGQVLTGGGGVDTSGGGVDTGGGGVQTSGGGVATDGGRVTTNGGGLSLASVDGGARFSLDAELVLVGDGSVDGAHIPVLWGNLAASAAGGTVPVVPAVPNVQDVVNALVALGLVTQAAP